MSEREGRSERDRERERLATGWHAMTIRSCVVRLAAATLGCQWGQGCIVCQAYIVRYIYRYIYIAIYPVC